MARKARIISAPSSKVFTNVGTFQLGSGSSGIPMAPPGPEPQVQERVAAEPESSLATDDDAWARELERRELNAGFLAAPPAVVQLHPDDLESLVAAELGDPLDGLRTPPMPPPPPGDLTSLPDRFALEVERKGDGWWVVRAPGVHVGLFVANPDLGLALAHAPAALAGIVRLDGRVPQAKPRRPSTKS